MSDVSVGETGTGADWIAWSKTSWRRHLPGVVDPAAFVAGVGKGTVHGLAHSMAIAAPERPAISIGNEMATHSDLDQQAARAAAWFVQRIRPGERIVLCAPVSMQWIAAYLGALRAGAVVVLANPSLTPAELAALSRLAEPALTVTDAGSVLEEPGSEHWIERSSPDSTALLAFTSGTTGAPKGVPLTHRRLLASIRTAMAAWAWSSDDVLVHALPLYHQHGLGGVHATLIVGSTLHIVSRYEPDLLLDTVTRTRATVLFAVPTMYHRLGGLPSKRNRLRLAISGSSALSRHTAARAVEVLGIAPLVRYGTTESGLDVSHVYAEGARLELAETIGVPLPGVEVRLAPDGEIQVRGPQVFSGYWREVGPPMDAFTADGWFRTGDIGRTDVASGHLVLAGRSKEVVITGGLKVYPREVELVLEKHPSVVEAAVAGLASENWGEQVTAWVVLLPGAVFDERALIEHARSLLSPYKCPKQVFVVDALPRNQLGKIDRNRLKTVNDTNPKQRR